MIRTLIIEDEENSREILISLIGKYCPMLEIIDVAIDGQQAVDKINTLKPQLVLLDIELPYGNAFEVLERVNEIDFQIIFITAYNEYLMNALKSGAIDYLLKPIDHHELIIAVNKASDIIQDKKIQHGVEQLLQSLSKQIAINHLALPTLEGYSFVKIDDIIRVDADGSYSKITCAGNKQYFISKQLHDLEEKLPGHLFIRIHHSHIVNINHVKEYIKGRGGYIILSDGSSADVSSRKKDEFLDRLL